MSNLPKTIGFGAIQLSATTLIHSWCKVVHWRFEYDHPGGVGPVISHIYWNYSWVGIAVAAMLTGILVFSHIKKRSILYETTFYFGVWLLVVWFGFALVATDIAFLGWGDLRGRHF
jgi:hypothetical protein